MTPELAKVRGADRPPAPSLLPPSAWHPCCALLAGCVCLPAPAVNVLRRVALRDLWASPRSLLLAVPWSLISLFVLLVLLSRWDAGAGRRDAARARDAVGVERQHARVVAQGRSGHQGPCQCQFPCNCSSAALVRSLSPRAWCSPWILGPRSLCLARGIGLCACVQAFVRSYWVSPSRHRQPIASLQRACTQGLHAAETAEDAKQAAEAVEKAKKRSFAVSLLWLLSAWRAVVGCLSDLPGLSPHALTGPASATYAPHEAAGPALPPLHCCSVRPSDSVLVLPTRSVVAPFARAAWRRSRRTTSTTTCTTTRTTALRAPTTKVLRCLL